MTSLMSRRNGALTLVELLVATAIMTLILVGIGTVFSQTSRAVTLTQEALRVNSIARAVNAVLRDDMRAAQAMVLTEPGAIILLKAGRFESKCETDAAGRPLTANMALVYYFIATDTDGVGVLCRAEYLLIGRDDVPCTSADLLAVQTAAVPGDVNLLDNTDLLGCSLRTALRDSTSFSHNVLRPLLSQSPTVNLSPQRLDDPASGGVRQAWQVLAPGVVNMTLRFTDGMDDACAAPVVDRVHWIDVDATGGSPASKRLLLPHRPGEPDIKRTKWIAPGVSGIYWIFDELADAPETRRPRAVKVTLRMTCPKSPNGYREFQFICGL